MYTAQKIAGWCGGLWLADPSPNRTISELATDSRKLNAPPDAMFVAMVTNLRNGHDFIRHAYEQGVRTFLIQKRLDTHVFPEANFILVTDTLSALQQIAATHRAAFTIPVIGITGSNGKTIVKEWLYHMLQPCYTVARSPLSYNSQIGVPLSVWQIRPNHELAIFEAGISQPGEMERLEPIIRPTLGVFTNIGDAHSEGFDSQQQKVAEKIKLFQHCRTLVYCLDYPDIHAAAERLHLLRAETAHPMSLFAWSFSKQADLMVVSQKREHNQTVIHARYKGDLRSISIPFTDPASIENAIHCWCVGLLSSLPPEKIDLAMRGLQPVAMRLELLHGVNHCLLINDAYNSDKTSLMVALDTLAQQKGVNRRTVILSDLLQSGEQEHVLYNQVARMVMMRGVERFIGVGPSLFRNQAPFQNSQSLESNFFKTTADLLQAIHRFAFQQEAILIKGARTFAFEKIVKLLEEKSHQTVLAINLSAIIHNLNVFRRLVTPGTKIMAMVKAFSYGSGSYEIASLLQHAGVDYLAVAYTDEGIELRKAGISLPIMVMSPDVSSFDRMIHWNLEPELYSISSLRAFLQMAESLQTRRYPVHIKVETGMHRLGFEAAEIADLMDTLAATNAVRVRSIFSQLAASDNPAHDAFTQQQADRFSAIAEAISTHLAERPLRHLCNSAAIARHPHLHFDMVRLGLGLYGIASDTSLSTQLRQVGTLTTTIAQIKQVPPGESVGYNRKAMMTKPAQIATLSIGYADGFPRSLSNGIGHVLIHGKPAPVVGQVCMDMCMVNITHIPEAVEGDTAIIFSPDLPITQLAASANTIPYEIMAGIAQRVKRIYVSEN